MNGYVGRIPKLGHPEVDVLYALELFNVVFRGPGEFPSQCLIIETNRLTIGTTTRSWSIISTLAIAGHCLGT